MATPSDNLDGYEVSYLLLLLPYFLLTDINSTKMLDNMLSFCSNFMESQTSVLFD